MEPSVRWILFLVNGFVGTETLAFELKRWRSCLLSCFFIYFFKNVISVVVEHLVWKARIHQRFWIFLINAKSVSRSVLAQILFTHLTMGPDSCSNSVGRSNVQAARWPSKQKTELKTPTGQINHQQTPLTTIICAWKHCRLNRTSKQSFRRD